MSIAEGESSSEAYKLDVFEINDFTVVTDFERFVVNLESAIEKWDLYNRTNNSLDLSKVNIDDCVWNYKTAKVAFGSRNSLDLTHYWPVLSLNEESPILLKAESASDRVALNTSKDEHIDALPNAAKLLRMDELDFNHGSLICHQFGIVEFLLLTPTNWNIDQVSNEDQLQTVLSGINAALSNGYCDIPVFVQFGDFSRHSYFGICQDITTRILFQSVHLNSSLEIHEDLEGIKKIFCDKLSANIDPHELDVSYRVELALQKDDLKSTVKYSPYEELESLENFSLTDSTNLPFGASVNIVESFIISGNFREVLFDDSKLPSISCVHSSSWDATISTKQNIPCSMHSCLKLLTETLEKDESKKCISSFLPSALDKDVVPLSAFSSLTGSNNISITNPAGIIDDGRKLSMVELYRWIDCIFMKENKHSIRNDSENLSENIQEKAGGPGIAIKSQSDCNISECKFGSETAPSEIPTCFAEQLKKCKASPANSLTNRICVALAKFLSIHGPSVFAFAELWEGIVRELREYWNNSRCLTGFEANIVPNHSACKFQQTLQMLQCCINARSVNYKLYEQNLQYLSSDDEFYDAVDITREHEDQRGSEFTPSVPEREPPQGRKSPIDGLYLLNFPSTPMYEPFIQERCPMTEEMLENYNDYLSSLSPKLRVRAQLDILYSDMEAFKAANPGCVFEDFIRWHSPRDYTMDKITGLGCLSSRMEGTNQWTEAWNDTKPIPVLRQKRLFNESKEAESLLEKLSRLTLGEVIKLILPVTLKSAVTQLICEFAPFINCGDASTLLKADLLSLCGKVVHFTKYEDIDDAFDLFKQIKCMEEKITVCNAVLAELITAEEPLEKSANDILRLREFVLQLSQNNEKNISNGTHEAHIRRGVILIRNGPLNNEDFICRTVHSLFFVELKEENEECSGVVERHQKCYKKLKLKEAVTVQKRRYVLRCSAKKPSQKSRLTPQRMYASLSKDEFRLALSISEDTVFC